MMITSEKRLCRGPNCKQQLDRHGEGKLFTFRIRSLKSEQCNHMEVWLCEECFQNWQPILYQEELVLMPIARRVA